MLTYHFCTRHGYLSIEEIKYKNISNSTSIQPLNLSRKLNRLNSNILLSRLFFAIGSLWPANMASGFSLKCSGRSLGCKGHNIFPIFEYSFAGLQKYIRIFGIALFSADVSQHQKHIIQNFLKLVAEGQLVRSFFKSQLDAVVKSNKLLKYLLTDYFALSKIPLFKVDRCDMVKCECTHGLDTIRRGKAIVEYG